MRRTLGLLALVALAACGDASTRPSVEPIEGVYTLRTVNGAPLPYRTTASNAVFDLTSGRLSLSIPGTFTIDMQGTQQVGTETPYVVLELVSGTWRAEGNTHAHYGDPRGRRDHVRRQRAHLRVAARLASESA